MSLGAFFSQKKVVRPTPLQAVPFSPPYGISSTSLSRLAYLFSAFLLLLSTFPFLSRVFSLVRPYPLPLRRPLHSRTPPSMLPYKTFSVDQKSLF
jgi:hypothetical protein